MQNKKKQTKMSRYSFVGRSWADIEDSSDDEDTIECKKIAQMAVFKTWSAVVSKNIATVTEFVSESKPEYDSDENAEDLEFDRFVAPKKKTDKEPRTLALRCQTCPDVIPFTPKMQAYYEMKKWHQPKICGNCKQSGKTGKDLFCTICTQTFHFSYNLQQKYKQNNWSEPKTCFECRQNNKQQKKKY